MEDITTFPKSKPLVIRERKATNPWKWNKVVFSGTGATSRVVPYFKAEETTGWMIKTFEFILVLTIIIGITFSLFQIVQMFVLL